VDLQADDLIARVTIAVLANTRSRVPEADGLDRKVHDDSELESLL